MASSGSDGQLMTHYFNIPNRAGFTTAQPVAISGYEGLQAFIDAANQSGRTDPVPGRVDIAGYASAPFNAIVPVSLRYNPVTNMDGAPGHGLRRRAQRLRHQPGHRVCAASVRRRR